MQIIHSRRQFLTTASLATAAGPMAPGDRSPSRAAGDDPIRLKRKRPSVSLRSNIVEELLRAEGFERYPVCDRRGRAYRLQMICSGDLDFDVASPAGTIMSSIPAYR